MYSLAKGLYAKLLESTELTTLLGGAFIYNPVPPKGTALPWVAFSFSSGEEGNVTPSQNWTASYLVKGVAATLKLAEQIADELYATLQHATLMTTGMTNYLTRRTTIVSYEEYGPGGEVLAAHCGGIYRVDLEVTG